MKKIAFTIETTEKRGNWVYVAADKCYEKGINTLECGIFSINGKMLRFSFDVDLKVVGLMGGYGNV